MKKVLMSVFMGILIIGLLVSGVSCSKSPQEVEFVSLSLDENCKLEYGIMNTCNAYIIGIVKNYTDSTRDVEIKIQRWTCSVKGGGEASYVETVGTDTVSGLKPNEEREWTYRVLSNEGYKYLYYSVWKVQISPWEWTVEGRSCLCD